MGENAEHDFALLRGRSTGTNGGTEHPFGLGEGAFDVPALSVGSFGKVGFHLPAVGRRGRSVRMGARIERNHRGAYAECFAAQTMIVLAVVSGVSEDPSEGDVLGGLRDGGRELRRIVTRTPGDPGAREQVGRRMAHRGEFGPSTPSKGPVALAVHIVGAGMAGLQARGVHGALRPLVDEIQRVSACEHGAKQRVQSPFFRSRCSA